MAKTRLLQAVCAAAMLAAVPAFAQSNNPVGQTGSSGDNTPQTRSGQVVSPGTTTPAAPNSYGTMSQSGSMAPGSQSPSGGHSGMHHSAMGMHGRHMMQSSHRPSSQDAAVDQLNDQSLRAARQGQAFNGPTGAGMSGGSGGSMSDMPSGTSSDSGSASGASSSGK